MASSVDLLPMELQCSIIRLLDPVALISISQSSTHFRRLISPQKKHFAERLLTLELIPSHGGPTPTFRSRDNRITNPSPFDPEWNDIRWACTNCLRLLPYNHFDNHPILRLGYRKPSPLIYGAVPAVTTWEPAGHRVPRRRKGPKGPKKEKVSDVLSDDKKERHRYFICATGGQGPRRARHAPAVSGRLDLLLACGMTGFEQMTQDEFSQLTPEQKLRIIDENAILIERSRCGNKRHSRRCNECRYQLGYYLKPRLDGSGGSSKMPIVVSRQITYGTLIDRWFPGFSEHMQNKRPEFNAPLFRIYRENPCDSPMTTWMARCPQCSRWQELRHFRIGGIFQHWNPQISTEMTRGRRSEPRMTWDMKEITPSLLDSSRCNTCFAKANGRTELARILLEWLDLLIGSELIPISSALCKGFIEFGRSVNSVRGVSQKLLRELKSLLQHTPCLRKPWDYVVTYSDIATLRLRIRQFRDLWDAISVHTGSVSRGMDPSYEQWVREFEEAEEHWRWMVLCREELAERPEALAEWTLGGGTDESG